MISVVGGRMAFDTINSIATSTKEEEIETPGEITEDIAPENIEPPEKEEIKPETEETDNEVIEDMPEQPQEELQETDDNVPPETEFQEENSQTDTKQEEISKWEEIDDDNNVVKKYIVYIFCLKEIKIY